MLKNSIVALALCLVTLGCASPGVPAGASVEYNPTTRSGFTRSWRRTVDGGCANFNSEDGALAVRLSIDPTKCRGPARADANCDDECGPGLLYFSDNYIVVQGFWPWTTDDMTNGMIFDANGMWQGVRPCPHSLTPDQYAAMRHVAQGAVAQATTEPERQTLQRIDQVLAASTNVTMQSGQLGCMLRDNGFSPQQGLAASPQAN